MLKPLLKLKRSIKRLLKIKEDIDRDAGQKHSAILIKYLIGIAGVVLITLLYPASELYGPLDVPREGEIAPENVIADFSFDIQKNEAQFIEEKRLTRLSTPLFFDYNAEVAQSSRNGLRQLFSTVDSLKSALESNDPGNPVEVLIKAYPYLSARHLELLIQTESSSQLGAIIDSILTDDIYFYGVVTDLSRMPSPEYKSVVMRKQRRDLLMVRSQLIDLQRAYNILLNRLNEENTLKTIDVELGYEIGRHFIFPNAAFNEATTRIAQDSSEAVITGVEKRVTAGDLLIRR